MSKFDIAIIGAGINGLVAALALGGQYASRPLRVVVIDRADPHRFASSSYDSRASALTSATQTMFAVLGLWESVKAQAQNMVNIAVTDAGYTAVDRPVLLSFPANESGKPAAAMVENYHLFASALAEIKNSPGITLLTGSSLKSINFGPGLARVTLEDGSEIKSSLVIGADGRTSVTREAAGLKLQGWAYSQSAITLTVAHELPHMGTAEEHFTPTGVFAILPLPGNRSSLVWTENHDDARRISELDDPDFLQELSQRFGTHRGTLSLASPRHVYPLSLMLADEMVATRLALIGDAAHVIHPLAGLGLNLGFKDVAALAECVMDTVALGQDIGGDAVLQRYASWRRFDTVSTAYALDGMNRLFANYVPGMKFIRDAGLRMVNASAPVKNLFMKEAAGQTGTLPKLMRGLAA